MAFFLYPKYVQYIIIICLLNVSLCMMAYSRLYFSRMVPQGVNHIWGGFASKSLKTSALTSLTKQSFLIYKSQFLQHTSA